MLRNKLKKILIIGLASCFLLSGCGSQNINVSTNENVDTENVTGQNMAEQNSVNDQKNNNDKTDDKTDVSESNDKENPAADIKADTNNEDNFANDEEAYYEIPENVSEPYTIVNNNEPYFDLSDYTTEAFETYSDLDSLGRCGVAYANICQELMPTEERGDISSVKPTGWHNQSYDFVDGKYVYNRCHLIAYELAGENANEKNLITGTRYFNVDGMLPFENMVADYVRETDNHVLYRVTPIFVGDNLVANGVLMEAYSVEDGGDGIEFCVFCYNVQPGVTIDYATGENWADGTNGASDTSATQEEIKGDGSSASSDTGTNDTDTSVTYVLNTSSKKFHLPTCSNVSNMNENNKEEYTGTRDELIKQGYEPCGFCKP